MRVTALIVALTIGLLGSTAFAEKVKTNQEAKLLNHPGEQGAVLLRLKEGQTMTLLSEDGRWLKVRVQGRTGFIPRSKVDMPDKDEIARNTRRRPFVDGRGTKRGFGGGEGPDDRIGADATGTSGATDGDDATAKKTAKTTASGDDDDDDDAKKSATKKPPVKKVAAGKKSGDDDDDDDDAKKPAAKKPPVKKAAAKKSGDDDDDDDDAKKPAAKKPPVKKAAAKKSGDDDDDDDAKKPAAKKSGTKKVAAKGDDDDDDAKKTRKSGDDDAAGEDDNADKRPKAHVGAKTKVFDERNKTSSVSFVAKPNEVLYTGETKGDWTMVENSEGDAGWALTSGLDVDGGESGPDTRSKSIDLTASVGVTFIQQGMRTAGSTKTTGDMVPDAYNIGASAATIAIGGGILVPYGKKAYFGGELTYDGSKTIGGGIYYMMVKTGFTIHDINARALAAYDFHRPSGMLLVGHLGFRYRAYLVDGYADATTNPARIPQETLKAPTLGVALAMPTFSEKIGLQFGLDTILFGSSIAQTAGLEDGATPTMKDVELSAHLVYRWKKDMNLEASYQLDYGSYDFGMPPADSTRGHTGTDVTRTDILHMVTLGIIKGF